MRPDFGFQSTLKHPAWQKGYDSYETGKRLKNPYRFRSNDWELFQGGWLVAEFDDPKVKGEG